MSFPKREIKEGTVVHDTQPCCLVVWEERGGHCRMQSGEVCSDGSTGTLGDCGLDRGFCLLFSMESSVGSGMTRFMFGRM